MTTRNLRSSPTVSAVPTLRTSSSLTSARRQSPPAVRLCHTAPTALHPTRPSLATAPPDPTSALAPASATVSLVRASVSSSTAADLAVVTMMTATPSAPAAAKTSMSTKPPSRTPAPAATALSHKGAIVWRVLWQQVERTSSRSFLESSIPWQHTSAGMTRPMLLW